MQSKPFKKLNPNLLAQFEPIMGSSSKPPDDSLMKNITEEHTPSVTPVLLNFREAIASSSQ